MTNGLRLPNEEGEGEGDGDGEEKSSLDIFGSDTLRGIDIVFSVGELPLWNGCVPEIVWVLKVRMRPTLSRTAWIAAYNYKEHWYVLKCVHAYQ